MKFEELRQRYPTFSYTACETNFTPDGIKAQFRFSSTDLHFTHTILITGVTRVTNDPERETRVQKMVEHLGLVELLSYWKLVCSPNIQTPALHLTEEQFSFWNQLTLHGMGEYFYKNQIDFTVPGFLKLNGKDLSIGEVEKKDGSQVAAPKTSESDPDQTTLLVPIGGGKDSIVTGELLKPHFPITPCIVNPTAAEEQVASLLTDQPAIRVQRTFDPLLTQLNQQGYLNGHVPFSATLAFLSVVAADLAGLTHVAISNERSSNEGTVTYKNHTINHQYSKTVQFETALSAYIQPLTSVHYFSFVRPLYELQIAKLFAHLPDYFPVFRSCNRGQKTNSWCGHCPKCLALTLILLPWVGIKQIQSIFSSNPLDDSTNIPLVHELGGKTKHKPFECVTTTEETLVALHLCIQVYTQAGQPLPPVLADAAQHVLAQEQNLDQRAQDVLDAWETSPNMPPQFEQLLKVAYHEVI